MNKFKICISIIDLAFQLAIFCLVASAAASGIYGHPGYAAVGHHGYAAGYAYPLADHVPAAVNGLQVVTKTQITMCTKGRLTSICTEIFS